MNNYELMLLSEQIYNNNKAKGFHEEEHSDEHYSCLIVSEMMEAVEADRKGLIANLPIFNQCIKAIPHGDNDSYTRIYNTFIKDTIQDELADTIIRLLDLSYAKSYPLHTEQQYKLIVDPNRLITENMWSLINEMVSNIDKKSSSHISSMIHQICQLCSFLSVDIWRHIDIKIRYNTLRPYKHLKHY